MRRLRLWLSNLFLPKGMVILPKRDVSEHLPSIPLGTSPEIEQNWCDFLAEKEALRADASRRAREPMTLAWSSPLLDGEVLAFEDSENNETHST